MSATATAPRPSFPTEWSRPEDGPLGVMRVLRANPTATESDICDMYRLLTARFGWDKQKWGYPASLIPELVADGYLEVAGVRPVPSYRLSELGRRVVTLGHGR